MDSTIKRFAKARSMVITHRVINGDGDVLFLVRRSVCGEWEAYCYLSDDWLAVDTEGLEVQEIDYSLLDAAPNDKPSASISAEKYPKYFKGVSDLSEIDVYAVHRLFDIDDPAGCIHHASKKLLLSGVRTGGKSKHDDIREARDTLNRWLELNP